MSKEIQDIALAESYLNGELTNTEKEAVEQRLKTDQAFAQLLTDTQVLLEGTRSAFRENVEAQLRDLEADLPAIQLDEASLFLDTSTEEEKSTDPQSKTRRLDWSWRYGVAAVLIPLLLALAWLMWPKPNPQEQLFAKYYEVPQRVSLVNRGTANREFDELQQEAFSNYDQQRYAAAILDFQELVEVHNDTLSLFYLGIMQLGNHEPSSAIQNLKRFQQLSDDIRIDHVDYYLALAYVLKGDWEEASELLVSLDKEQAIQLKTDVDQLYILKLNEK